MIRPLGPQGTHGTLNGEGVIVWCVSKDENLVRRNTPYNQKFVWVFGEEATCRILSQVA